MFKSKRVTNRALLARVPYLWNEYYANNTTAERDDGVRFRDEQACRYRRHYIVSLAVVSVQTRRTQREIGPGSV